MRCNQSLNGYFEHKTVHRKKAKLYLSTCLNSCPTSHILPITDVFHLSYKPRYRSIRLWVDTRSFHCLNYHNKADAHVKASAYKNATMVNHGGELLMFDIEDISKNLVESHQSLSIQVAADTVGIHENHAVPLPTYRKLEAFELKEHAQELVESLTSFRSTIGRLGTVFTSYATDPLFWFAGMCFARWLERNAHILKGSWVCPNGSEDALTEFLKRKSQVCRSLIIPTQSSVAHDQAGESVLEIFERAKRELQRFEVAYRILSKLDDDVLVGAPVLRVPCQAFRPRAYPGTLGQPYPSELIHMIGDLEVVGTILNRLIKAATDDPASMSTRRYGFETSSFQMLKLKREMKMLEAIRHTTELSTLCENQQDDSISLRIANMEESWKHHNRVRQDILSRLLGEDEEILKEFEKGFDIND